MWKLSVKSRAFELTSILQFTSFQILMVHVRSDPAKCAAVVDCYLYLPRHESVEDVPANYM